MEKDYLIVVTAKNHTGVIQRISGLFSRRFFNIISLVAAQSEDPEISHIIIVVHGDANAARQARKQLSKLYDVLDIEVLNDEKVVVREHLMLKVAHDHSISSQLVALANVFHANVLFVNNEYMIVELTGEPNIITSFVELFKPFGIKEMLRTGAMAMSIE